MRTLDMALEYKGDRPYVRGVDIFHQIAALGLEHTGFDAGASLGLAFREIVTRQCTLSVCAPGEAAKRPQGVAAECVFSHDGATARAWVIQGTDPVTRRVEYGGDATVRAALSVDGQSVTAPRVPEAPALDQAVTMTKALCQTLLPGGNRSWILTRMELNRLDLQCRESVRVDLAHNMKDVFTKSTLFLDGERRGHLYFSLVDLG